jgi:hypothetical protein
MESALLLHIMSDMFSLKDMLKFFVESECEDEPCQLGNNFFFKGIEEEKNF